MGHSALRLSDGLALVGQVARFGVVGLLATGTHVGAFVLFIELAGLSPMAANVGAFVVALGVSFVGHHYWTFAEGRNGRAADRAALRFAVVALFGFGLNALAVHVITGILAAPYGYAAAFMAVVTPASTFLLSKLWAFADPKAVGAVAAPEIGRWAWLVPVVSVAVGGALRLAAIDADLPFRYNPDESIFSGAAARILANQDLNPHWFGGPAHFTIYLLAACYGLYIVGGVLVGHFTELAAAAAEYHYDPANFYRIGRASIVVFSIANVALVYRLARMVSGIPAAALASVLAAVSPLLVQYAFWIRPDNQLTFFLSLGCLFAAGIVARGRTRDYVAAGVCLGLAVACKYPGVVFAAAIAAAHALRGRDAWWADITKMAFAALASVVAAFAAAPFLFLDFASVLKDVTYEARSHHLGATSEGFLSALAWYITEPLRDNLGTLGLGLAAVGAWCTAIRPAWRPALVVVALVAVYTVFIASLSLQWERWILPVIPLACVLVALGVESLLSAAGRLTPVKSAVAAVLVGAAVAVPVSWRMVDGLYLQLGEDTRTVSHEWIVANVPMGSRILAERYVAQLPGDRYEVFDVNSDGKIEPLPQGERYLEPRRAIGHLRNVEDVDRMEIEFVVLANDYERLRAVSGTNATLYADKIATYENLFEKIELIHTVEPIPGRRGGPPNRIYRVRRD